MNVFERYFILYLCFSLQIIKKYVFHQVPTLWDNHALASDVYDISTSSAQI